MLNKNDIYLGIIRIYGMTLFIIVARPSGIQYDTLPLWRWTSCAPDGLLSPEWKVFLRMLLEPTEIYSVFHLTLKCYTKFHKTKHYSNEFISTYSFIVLLFSCCWLWFFNNCKRTWVHHHEKGNRYLNQVYFFNVCCMHNAIIKSLTGALNQISFIYLLLFR